MIFSYYFTAKTFFARILCVFFPCLQFFLGTFSNFTFPKEAPSFKPIKNALALHAENFSYARAARNAEKIPYINIVRARKNEFLFFPQKQLTFSERFSIMIRLLKI